MEENKVVLPDEGMNPFAHLEGEEDVNLRDENVKHFDLGSGRRQAIMYPEAVHYRAQADSPWEEIDNNLEAATDAYGRNILRNRQNATQVDLASTAESGDLVTLRSGDVWLSWKFEKETSAVSPSVKPGHQLKLENLALLLGKPVSDLTEEDRTESAEEKRLDYTEKTAQAQYDEILPGLSVRYTLVGNKLKEDLILLNRGGLENAALVLKGDMEYSLNEDQTISIRRKGSEETVFLMEAPVAHDANGEAIPVTPMLQQSEDRARLSYAIPEACLDAAAYPVTIDPTIVFNNTTYIQDLTLTQGMSVAATGKGTQNPYLKIGISSSKENVAMVRFLRLAKLKSSDTIISARLRMASKSGSSAKYVAAHEVKIPWSPKQINYDTFLSGTPEEVAARVSPDELDYSDSSTSAYMVFDLTNIYRKWYEAEVVNGVAVSGKNYGVMLRKAARVSGNQYQEIHSAEASASANRPVFYVNYISHAGLEGWRQYESRSAGRAGMVHTDLFNGNMVLEHVDTQMNGNLAPVSLSHYYNSCLSKDNPWRCGHGWTHSGLQRVYQKTVDSTDYYVWVDGDGTEHWFRNRGVGNESKDQEGMQLTLTRYAATSNYPSRVEIIDKSHGKLLFCKRPDLSGTGTWNDFWLIYAADAYGNKAEYGYAEPSNPDSSTEMRELEGKLQSITDGAGRATTLTYTNNLLSHIDIPDAAEGTVRRVSYTYDGSDRLTGITYSELGAGIHTSYAYLEGTNLLAQATNFDGRRVLIGYEDTSKYWDEFISGGADDQMRRVTSLETQGVVNGATTYGARQVFEYRNMCTEVTAVDAADPEASTGKKITYQFNDVGNVTCIKDELGHAQFTKFSASLKNAPSESSKMQKAVVNRLRRPDFSGEWSSVIGGTDTVTLDTATRCLGEPSVAIAKTGAGESLYRQSVSLEAGKTWSLSAYVKTAGFADGTGNVFLRVKEAAGGNVLASGYPLRDLTPEEDDKDLPTDDWERLHVTFKTTEAVEAYVELVNGTDAGTAYFSCPQLEEGAVANSFNMVSNGDFRLYAPHETTPDRLMPVNWTPGGDLANQASAQVMIPASNPGDPACDTFPAALGGNLVRVPGAPNDGSACFYQDINVKGGKNDVFVLGGWAKAKSAPNASTPDRGFRLTLKFYTADGWAYGNDNNSMIPFNCEWVGWQYMTGVCAAPAAYTKIRFYVVYMKNINDASFSNVFVHKEQFGRSFAYDSKKNLLSVENLAAKKSGMVYDDFDNLIRYRRPGTPDTNDYKYKFNYGSTDAAKKKHRLLSSETPMEMKQHFEYDSKGNLETAKVQKDNGAALIKTRTAYTADQNYVLEKYDARGKKVSQVTNPRTGTLTSVTDPGNTTVNYTYDASRRITGVETTVDGKTYRNAYTYEGDRLKTVSHNTTSGTPDVTYTFAYDALGAQTTVKVGNQVLSENVYSADRSRRLEQVVYGNDAAGSPQRVKYAYDDFDRLTGISYDAADPAIAPRYSYEYGANGQIAQVKDNELNRTQWTEYDQAQRPIQWSTRNDANGELLYRTSLKYNKLSNLIRFREQVGSASYSTEYNYDRDDRTAKIAYEPGSGIHGVEYVYDSVNRVASVKRGTATITKVSGKKDREIAVTEIPALGTAYTFAQGDTNYGAGATTPLVAGITHGPAAAPVMVFGYAYDDCGNIVSETRDGLTTTYKYDKLGQLTRVNDPHENATWLYNYDRGGNILSKVKHAFTTNADPGTALDTIPYGYGDTNWKDKLTAYNGQTITYDAIGNPINDGTWTYTWGAGRQLRQMSKSGMTVQFKYDHNGLRTQKIVTENGVTTTTNYILHGKLVTGLKQGTNTMHFFYDALSRPQMVNFNGALYHYVHNLQCDIAAIVDNDGNKVVEYKYNAWGNSTGIESRIHEIDSTLTAAYANLANLNPFRYRGYVWDEETGLYYLRSRYYKPDWGRFVNSDSVLNHDWTILSNNQYIYCINNPNNLSDENGLTPNKLIIHFFGVGYDGKGHAAVQIGDAVFSFSRCSKVEVWSLKRLGKKVANGKRAETYRRKEYSIGEQVGYDTLAYIGTITGEKHDKIYDKTNFRKFEGAYSVGERYFDYNYTDNSKELAACVVFVYDVANHAGAIHFDRDKLFMDEQEYGSYIISTSKFYDLVMQDS
jgi:RHS repeat-associated protein